MTIHFVNSYYQAYCVQKWHKLPTIRLECRNVVKIMAFATEIFILIHYTAMRLLKEVPVVLVIIITAKMAHATKKYEAHWTPVHLSSAILSRPRLSRY